MSTKDFEVKNEFDDSNFYFQDYKDEEQHELNQLNERGELTTIKTPDGDSISVYLRLGNRILFCSGKYFYIQHTNAQTDHQKECTGIVSTCHTCGVTIKGSLKVSSNFICHLKARHPEVYKDFLKQKQELGAGTRFRKSEKSYSGHRTSPYHSNPQTLGNTLHQQENQDQFHRNILQFLIGTNQSLKLVEDDHFVTLFEFLDLKLKTPYQYEQMIKDDCKYKQLLLANFFNNSKVYICLTSDAWSFGECKYLALSCHWIDDQFQRQAALLACVRSPIKTEQCLQTLQNGIILRFGLQKDYIVNTVTSNIQNYKTDFVEFGINNELLCLDYMDDAENCTLTKEMQENLELLNVNNEAAINVIQLDVLKLNKIWGIGFTKHLDPKTKVLHHSCMEKCFAIWRMCHNSNFKERFEIILNGSLITPNLFSFTSLYTSLKQLYLQKNQLLAISDFLKQTNFSDLELAYLEELIEVLEPLHAAFEFLDMPQNHFYGCFLPTLVTLKWKLIRLHNSKKLIHLQELLINLKEQLLTEFNLYYELNDTKSESIIAAITYPPVKTRFLMGLQDSVLCFNFQARNLLLKYGKEYHHMNNDPRADNFLLPHNPENSMSNTTSATDFFDFGYGTENIDAEELRDVNISKKELSELISELYDGLGAEGLSMDNIDLETPRKFLLSLPDTTNNCSTQKLENNSNLSQQFDFERKHELTRGQITAEVAFSNQLSDQTECNIITSTNSHHDYTFQPDIMSTPSTHKKQTSNNNNTDANNEYIDQHSDNVALISIAKFNDDMDNLQNNTITIDSSAINTDLEFIAVPIPGQPNSFRLAKVIHNLENDMSITPAAQTYENPDLLQNTTKSKSLCNSTPYEINYTCNYISVRRHIIAEYIEKFKTLQHTQDNKISSTTIATTDTMLQNISTPTGFTQYQYDLMQQQLRIHIQQLTQTFIQTYCHPELWKLAPKTKNMLLDLQEKSKENINFQVWNLEPAVALIYNWQNELDKDTPENTELMNFLHHENSVTNHMHRQVPRFHPRILDCYLNSPVFMYPQYLPRMPFTAKSISVFSPAEAYLIAMGLEKHLQAIYEKNEKLSSNTTPLRVACRRLAKDTVCGKGYRRIWHHILHLQKVDYYNPIKYFFEHNRAPSVDHDPIYTFNNNIVLPPKDRIPELPLVFQTYLQKKNQPPRPKQIRNKKQRRTFPSRSTETYKNSYFEFVQEAVCQDLPIPNLFCDPVESSDILPSDTDSNTAIVEKRTKLYESKSETKRKLPQSVTVNVNYIYGNGLNVPEQSTNTDNKSDCDGLPDASINSTTNLSRNNLENTTCTDCPVITYNFDWRTKSLQPVHNSQKGETNATPYDSLNHKEIENSITIAQSDNKKYRIFRKISRTLTLHKGIKQKALAYRKKRHLKRRCEDLITTYSLYLDKIVLKYKDFSLIQEYYRRFKALELYTNLLKSLKNICNKDFNIMSNSPNLKRARNNNANTEDDNNSPSSTRQVRKLNRQEENFRHMLLPDTPEEAKRKDAIYAFNFYEKVEEAFKNDNKLDDWKKFNSILKTFDPKKDKVSDLYYKLEKLFLPDHPKLAQVFLTFLLPSEAVEIGKFFEHFMINNMGTFINKLNIYFNKQPAQIRKIYNCLNDLAEDPNVTMKTVETKIVPLLKGNQFLIDWFMQQFPQSTPPERLYSQPEHINLKDQQCNRSGEYMETVADLMDLPTNSNQQQQNCQLRYINGRIFYGSKMLLPAKLSFMALSYKDKFQANEMSTSNLISSCVHGIREHGEKRLQAATVLSSTHTNATETPSDDQDRSEEDVSKALVIDITADEEDSCSSVELCDDISLRAHATRLNPSVYSSSCYTAAHATGAPNLINNFQTHANAKKTHLNFHDEAKLSPRKNSLLLSTSVQSSCSSPLATSISNSPVNPKEKRKSPIKKTKSPLNNSSGNKTLRAINVTAQPMVVIHETISAIQCAKRLKSLIEGESQPNDSAEEVIDSKDIIKIVARSKKSLQSTENSTPAQVCEEIKEGRSEDLEFIAENSTLSVSPFPCLRIETDSNEEDGYSSKTPPFLPPQTASTTAQIRDENCKIDLVTSLTIEPENATATSDYSSQIVKSLNAAWTRDEDKIILIEMKMGSQNRTELYKHIADKLPNRTMLEITSRHQFLMDFLSKLQGK